MPEPTPIDDQAWFWTPEWQAGEREASAQLAAGNTERFDTDDEFFDALDRLVMKED